MGYLPRDFSLGSPGSSRQLALALFYALRDRPRADLLAVLRECERVLDADGWCAAERSEAQHRALRALRAYADAHEGLLPKKREYEMWIKSGKAPSGLPSDAAIRRAFGGSWTAAIKAARGGAPADIVQARRLRAQGSKYTAEELIAILQRYATAERVKVISLTAYQRWVDRELEADPNQRLPRWASTFANHGGFRQLVRRAGFRAHGDPLPTDEPGSLPVPLRLPHDGRYSDDELCEALRKAWSALEIAEYLTKPEYSQWRSGVTAAPSENTITNRFDSWPNALYVAGLISEAERDRRVRGQRTTRISDEFGLRMLAQAMLDKGLDVGAERLSQWRDEQLEADTTLVPPSVSWYRNRFKALGRARELAAVYLTSDLSSVGSGAGLREAA